MPDKILDIIPPRKASRKKPEAEDEPFWSVGKVILLAVIVVIGASVFSYLNFAEAEVEIWPRTEKVEANQLVTVEQTATSVSESVIPGEMISNQVKDSEQFDASRIDKEQKAQGKIRVYNESNQRLNFLSGTRFMSASQNVYFAEGRVPIPPAQWSGGEKQPGHVDITVTAAEAGEDYNVKEAKFSVPGLSGGALYHKIYAKTITEIKGGFEGKANYVTEQDVQEAKQTLRDQLKERGKNELEKKDYNIIPGTFVQSATDTFVSAQPGMKTDKFTVQEKVDTQAFAFKQQDLKELVGKLGRKELEGGEIDDSSLNIDYEVSEVYPDQGRALINVDYSATVYSPVEKEKLKKEIQGMPLPDLYSWLDQKEEVAESKITTWPNWMRSLPSDQNRINVEVLIE